MKKDSRGSFFFMRPTRRSFSAAELTRCECQETFYGRRASFSLAPGVAETTSRRSGAVRFLGCRLSER